MTSDQPAQLTPRQRWIIGLGGVLSRYNNESFTRLHPFEGGGDQVAKLMREQLAANWDVSDRTSLLQTLTDLLAEGHRLPLADQLGHPPLAWDYARYVNLVRWAHAAEIVDEDTSWQLLEAVVKPVTNTYRSWGSFTRDFIAGRTAWNGESDRDVEKAAMDLWNPLKADQNPSSLVSWPRK